MSELKPVPIYQLKVSFIGISPMIWRRLLVRSDSTIADLHYTLQIAMGWSDAHLNRFHIHGQDFGVYHDGGICFSDNPEKVPLSAFGFRIRERFLYEYDFGDEWLHEVRIEKRFLLDPKKTYPVCIDGGYVRKWNDKKTHFEMIVGKSIPEEGSSKCFGLVQSYDDKPKRRLFEVLKGQGMQLNQQITFFLMAAIPCVTCNFISTQKLNTCWIGSM